MTQYYDKNGEQIMINQKYYDDECDLKVSIVRIGGKLYAQPDARELDSELLENVCMNLIKC